MKTVTVMPFVVPDFAERCLDRCKMPNLLVVDNSVDNLGIMRSHNLGIDAMRDLDADWLIIMSAAIRFGDAGGLDFIDALEGLNGTAVVNAEGLFGWHLMAFARETVEAAGRWDENFTPYGLDDCDYAIRIHKSRPGVPWRGVKVDVMDTIMGHSIKLGGVQVDNRRIMDYFEGKWGSPPGPPFETFHNSPWNNVDLPIGYWPDFADGRWDQPAPRTNHGWMRDWDWGAM